jgi:CRISPR/Cas system-associated endonuclease Cas1
LQLMNERMKKIELEYQLASKKFTRIDSMFNRLEADERNNRNNQDQMNSS